MSKHLVVRTLVALSVLLNLLCATEFLLRYTRRATTAGIRRVASVEDVRLGTLFVCHFRTPMPAARAADAGPLLTFSPRLDYELTWKDERTAILVPKQPPPPGKDYLVVPDRAATDRDGHSLRQAKATVATPPLRLTGGLVSERRGPNLIRLGFPFNGPVSPADLAARLEIRDESGAQLPLGMTETLARFVPGVTVEHPTGCRRLTVTLKPGLTALAGDRGLDELTTWVVQPSTRLEIGDVGSYDSEGRIFAFVELAGTVNTDELLGALTITPDPGPVTVSSGWNRYVLTGDFKPRAYYRLTFRQGLTTTDGRRLAEDTDRQLVTPSLGRHLAFATRGLYLPAHRAATLPMDVCNVTTLHAELIRIYPNNLLAFFRDGDCTADRHGPTTARKDFAPGLPADQLGRFDLPLASLTGTQANGVYALRTNALPEGAAGEDSYYGYYYGPKAETTLVLTDLALTAVRAADAIEIMVRSFANNTPCADCEVELFSGLNQSVGKALTGHDGRARVALPQAGPDGEWAPTLVVARRGDDVSALNLNERAHELSAFEYDGGAVAAGAYEAFLYTERGVCRPGEPVQISALVRDDTLAAAGGFPAQLTVTDPQGNTFRREVLPLDADGFLTTALAIPVHARTGVYTCTLRTPGEEATPDWGRCEFRVGTSLPDRLRVTLALDRESYTAPAAAHAEVQAAYYFGKPAAGCRLEATASYVREPFAPSGFDEFVFGNSEREVSLPGREQVHAGLLDADGRAAFPVRLPTALRPPAALGLILAATVSEAGGRGVSDVGAATVHVYPSYIGLRQDWKPGQAPRDAALPFSWVCLAPDGRPATPPAPLTYTLHQDTWRYVLVFDRKTKAYRHEWKKERQAVAAGAVPVTAGRNEGRLEVRCPAEGEFVLVVSGADDVVQTAAHFWYWQGDGGGTKPTFQSYLDLTTDRELYRSGDTARLSFTAPAAGHALVCTGNRRLGPAVAVPVKPGDNTVGIPLPETALGCLYASVTFVADTPNPGPYPRRLFGLVRLDVDQTAHRLDTALRFAESARPGERIPLELTLTAGGRPVAGRVQVFAVDEGILALSTYRTPDPFTALFGPRECALRFADVYDAVFPELDDTAGQRSAVGGDAIAGLLNPVATEQSRPAILVLPPVTVGPDGKARLDLELPDHTGALRVMAVAWNADGVGSQGRELAMHRDVSVLLTAPRAVAPGDEFEITAQIVNHAVAAGPAGRADFQITGAAALADAGLAVQPFSLAPGEEETFRVRCRAAADAVGPATVSVTVRLGDETETRTVSVPVRPPTPPVFEAGFVQVQPGTPYAFDARRDWLPGTARLTFDASLSPGLEAVGALVWLRRYPYGCLEQTTSAAFAWLQFPNLAASEGDPMAVSDKATAADIQRAIERVLLMEQPEGGFGMWPYDSRPWLSGSVFAAHFLAEAKARGIAFDDALWSRTLTFLTRVAQGGFGYHNSQADTAYALYVLASAGRPENGIAEGLLADDGAAPFVRFLAAAALIRGGRAATGAAGINRLLAAHPLDGDLHWDMDSSARRLGLALNVLLDVQPDSPYVNALFGELRKTRNREGHWGSTQTNGLAAAALGKWAGLHPEAARTRATVHTPDGDSDVTAKSPFRFAGPFAGEFRATADGPGPLYCSWTLAGVPVQAPIQEESNGMTIQRDYLTDSGAPVQTVGQGDLVRVRLRIATQAPRPNVVLVDLLPGGFEIEDAEMATRWAPPDSNRRLNVRFVEKREDRLLLFCDLGGHKTEPAEYTYTVRAVTRGRFNPTRVTAEAMYSPEVRAGLTPPVGVTVE